jgi:hypothetical protein
LERLDGGTRHHKGAMRNDAQSMLQSI